MTNDNGITRVNPVSSRLSPKGMAAIFSIFFLIYNLNLVPRPNSDAIPSELLPFSLIAHHTAYLDDYYQYYREKWQDPKGCYFLVPSGGHYLSVYPIVQSLIIAPAYLPVVSLLHLSYAPPAKIVLIAYVTGKIAASTIAALSAVAMYAVLVTIFGGGGMTLALTFAYGLGSTIWSQASQHLLQHGFSCLMVLCSLVFYLRAGGRRRFLFLSGLAAALAVAERYNNVFFAGILAAWVAAGFYRKPSAQIAFFASPFVLGSLLMWYNFHYFNNFSGGYEVSGIGAPLLAGLAGSLFSPSRGLFIYSPFLLASIAGMAIFIGTREYRRYPLLFGIAAAIVANIYLVSRWPSWWGGWCYGPRLLTEIVPLMILFIPFCRPIFHKSMVTRALFSISLAASIVIHAIGAFCYPNGMSNALPDNVDRDPSRLWNIAGNQIFVEARAGVYTEVFEDIFAKITGKASATQAEAPLPDSVMRASIIVGALPVRMHPGYSYRVRFSAVNRSATLWPSVARKDGAYGLFLGGYWEKNGDTVTRFDNKRTMLWDLRPGATWRGDLVVTAPSVPGSYLLGFDIFQAGNGWFHERGSTDSHLLVEVGNPPAPN